MIDVFYSYGSIHPNSADKEREDEMCPTSLSTKKGEKWDIQLLWDQVSREKTTIL